MRSERAKRSVVWILVGLTLAVLGGCANPEETRAKYKERGNEFLASGEFEKARVEFLNALRIDANDADARFGAGQAFEKVGSLQQAVGHYLAAIEVDPSHVPSHVALARLFTLARDTDRGGEQVRKVLEIEPANRDARALQASLLVLQDSRDEARKILDGVIGEDPAHEIAVPMLTALMVSSGDVAGATVVASNAVKLRPASPGFRAIYAQILYQSGDQDGYLAQVKVLTELEPNVQQHYVVLSRGLARAGRGDEAKQLLRARAQDSDSRLVYLQFLAETGAAQEAETEFARFVAEDPKDDETHYVLGEFLERSGRADDAERTYREVLAGASSDTVIVKAKLALARQLIARSDLNAARELIEDVRKDHPSNQQAILLAGQVAMVSNDPDAAIAEFRLALRDDPQNLDLHRLLASAYLANDQAELASETLERAVAIDSGGVEAKLALVQVRTVQGDFAGADSVLNEVLLLAPTNFAALELKYKLYLRQQRNEDAFAVADEISNLYPRSGLGPFYAGAALQAKGETARAIEQYRKALELQPGAAEPLSTLVRIYLADGKADSAREVLNGQLKLVREPYLVQKFLGDVEASQGNADAAAAFYAQAQQARPQFAMTYLALAALEQSRGRVDEQLRVLRQGIDATNDPRLTIELAEALQAAKRTDEAIEVYRAAAADQVRERTIANNFAMLLAEYQPSPANLDEALELTRDFEQSDNAAYLDTLGWVYFKRGELESAERVLKLAVARAPKSALLQYHLAKVLMDKGNAQEALAYFQSAIATGQRFTGIEDARSLRDRLSQS